MYAIKHFKTITKHKFVVMKYCFQVGLYKQGLLHDLSKYSPTEFFVGAKYFQGTQSPNNAERQEKGYSSAWLHHKGRNKHHYEYWIDYSMDIKKGMVGMEMPVQYVVEMFIDRLAASRIYNGTKFHCAIPWEYYSKGRDYIIIHPKTQQLLEHLLIMLRDKGEEETLRYIRHHMLKGKAAITVK